VTIYESPYYKTIIAGLLIFAFTLPLSKSAGNVLLFLLYPAGIIGVLSSMDFKKAILPNIRQPLAVAFSLFFLVALVGVLYTGKYSDGFHVANKFLSLPAIYLMVSVLIQSSQDEESTSRTAENLILAFVIGLMALNGIAVMTYLGIVGHKKFVLPLAPLNVHHIWFSNINALGLYAAASFLLFSPRGKSAGGRLLLFSSVLLAVICILLSISRTAWFGIALTSVIMTFMVTKNKKAFFIAVAAAAVACVVVYLFIPFVHARISMIASDIARFSRGETATSLGARFLMWKAALMMFLSNPLIGVGTGDYVPTMISYIKSGQMPEFLLEFNQPHNMYLFTLATNGLLGLAALLYIFYRALRFALPIMKSNEGERLFAFVAAATAVHFMIAGLTDSFFNIQILRYAFAFVMGVCVRSSVRIARSS
jgi:O-antigen ligase